MIIANVVGLDDANQALMDLPKSMSAAVIREALKKSGQLVADEANRMASAHQVTGRFATSFIVGTKKKSQRKGRFKKMAEGTVYVGSTDRKAHLIEFGTGPHLIRADMKHVLAGKSGIFGRSVLHPGTPARPVLRPAWDSQQQAMMTTFRTEVWKALEKARKRLAKKTGWSGTA